MTIFAAANQCQGHHRERRLEVHDGVECVVQLCLDCGRRELCWSRRPLRPDTVSAIRARDNKLVPGVGSTFA
jgi:hypothetical protein